MKFRCAHRWAFTRWGGPLETLEDPLEPATGNEVTIRVTHCGICHSDLHIRAGGFDMGGGRMSSLERAGTRLPVTMGHEICGEVVEVGPEVRSVAAGDSSHGEAPAKPWFAIGGIDAGRVPEVRAAGASRIVVVRALTAAADPAAAAAELRAATLRPAL